ncbi:DUF2809 domain-containing protein [uncultured Dokdonia sp.]|uniref:ribosomal maturation YjgA family protein n=1 Tax=uncultured Dokdonia sp. TaxID=575653 RepID=UPI002627CAC3|nr:DUF2809 domain-containing protein [uncultured Dokdonia sp.]
MTFNYTYFLTFCLLLIIEVGIALYIHDTIIRPFIGDLLVVILIYCFVRTFIKTTYLKAIIGVLLFAYVVEAIQATSFIDWIGLSNNKIAKIILGTTFDWKDILAYTLGGGVILIFENHYIKKIKRPL